MNSLYQIRIKGDKSNVISQRETEGPDAQWSQQAKRLFDQSNVMSHKSSITKANSNAKMKTHLTLIYMLILVCSFCHLVTWLFSQLVLVFIKLCTFSSLVGSVVSTTVAYTHKRCDFFWDKSTSLIILHDRNNFKLSKECDSSLNYTAENEIHSAIIATDAIVMLTNNYRL